MRSSLGLVHKIVELIGYLARSGEITGHGSIYHIYARHLHKAIIVANMDNQLFRNMGVPAHPLTIDDLKRTVGVTAIAYETSKDDNHLNIIVESLLRLSSMMPPDHVDRAFAIDQLEKYSRIRYEKKGNLEDIDNQIKAGRELLTMQLGQTRHAEALFRLSSALLAKYNATSAYDILQEAIGKIEESVSTMPPSSRLWPYALNARGALLASMYKETRKEEDLQSAIRTGKEALERGPANGTDRAHIASNVADFLRLKYEKSKEQGDLDDAIRIAKVAMTAAPLDDPDGVSYADQTRKLLALKYDKTQALEDIEEAIHYAREAVSASRPDNRSRGRYLRELSHLLISRYGRTGLLEDLREAIRVGRMP